MGRFKARPIDPGAGPRAKYGEAMRKYRETAGLSLEASGVQIGYDGSAVSRFETAERAVPPDLPAKLDELYGTAPLFTELYAMIADDRHPGRWRVLTDYEKQAARIATYAPQVVPGLLQTNDYARALLRGGRPDDTDAQVDDAVSRRVGRQAILRGNDSPSYSAVLDEAVLHRLIGSDQTTRDQLAALLPLVDTPRTTIQVWPARHGEHPLLGGTTVLLTLPDGKSAAWLEGSDEGQMIEDVRQVRARQRAYDRLCACAPSPRESAALIEQAMKEFAT